MGSFICRLCVYICLCNWQLLRERNKHPFYYYYHFLLTFEYIHSLSYWKKLFKQFGSFFDIGSGNARVVGIVIIIVNELIVTIIVIIIKSVIFCLKEKHMQITWTFCIIFRCSAKFTHISIMNYACLLVYQT